MSVFGVSDESKKIEQMKKRHAKRKYDTDLKYKKQQKNLAS